MPYAAGVTYDLTQIMLPPPGLRLAWADGDAADALILVTTAPCPLMGIATARYRGEPGQVSHLYPAVVHLILSAGYWDVCEEESNFLGPYFDTADLDRLVRIYEGRPITYGHES